MYTIKYTATFECPKGHRFEASAAPDRDDAEARCPVCFEEWIAANVPNGKQIDKAV